MPEASSLSLRPSRAALWVGAVGAIIRIIYLLQSGDDASLTFPILDCAVHEGMAPQSDTGGQPLVRCLHVPAAVSTLAGGAPCGSPVPVCRSSA